VDIDANSAYKRRIARMVRSTFSPQVLSEIGLFGSLYRLRGYREPVLVASCDGVGTKLMVAGMVGKHDTVGEDIVNHSVNDILTLGARPLFFLDYFAYSSLPGSVIPEVIKGLVCGCRRNGCALIGGEIATLPGLYPKGEYDLAGTIVGVVEQREIIDPKRICSGDVVLGLPSTGLHTNGYSLARKVLFGKLRLKPNDPLPSMGEGRRMNQNASVASALLRVHRSYLPVLAPHLKHVRALAHITGGGFKENIERLLPRNVDCIIYKDAWPVPSIFRIIQRGGEVPEREMYRVFNMGVGMVVIVRPPEADRMLAYLRRTSSAARRSSLPGIIGEIVEGRGTVSLA
jgi:phosphoribosylformylglycinamidine cyclo-ligase